MTRRQRYFIKQRLIGAGLLIGTVIAALLVPESMILSIFTVPMGLMCLFSKRMVWTDKYYYEVKYGKKEEETR